MAKSSEIQNKGGKKGKESKKGIKTREEKYSLHHFLMFLSKVKISCHALKLKKFLSFFVFSISSFLSWTAEGLIVLDVCIN